MASTKTATLWRRWRQAVDFQYIVATCFPANTIFGHRQHRLTRGRVHRLTTMCHVLASQPNEDLRAQAQSPVSLALENCVAVCCRPIAGASMALQVVLCTQYYVCREWNSRHHRIEYLYHGVCTRHRTQDLMDKSYP